MVTNIGDTINYRQLLADNATPASGQFALYMRARQVKWANQNEKTAEYNSGQGDGKYPVIDLESQGGFSRTISLIYIPYDASGTFASMKSMLNALSYWEKNNSVLYYWELNSSGNNWGVMSDDDDNSTVQLRVRVVGWNRVNEADNWIWNITLRVVKPYSG